MRNSRFFVVALLGLSACSDNPVSPRGLAPDAISGAKLAAVTSISNDVVPVDIQRFVPCANGGAGELVHATGSLHQIFTVVTDAAGGITVREQFQPQGLTGVGLTTGDRYQATGVTWGMSRFGPSSSEVSTAVNNFRFIGPGPDNNLLIHEETHVTFDANGVLTAKVDNLSIECR